MSDTPIHPPPASETEAASAHPSAPARSGRSMVAGMALGGAMAAVWVWSQSAGPAANAEARINVAAAAGAVPSDPVAVLADIRTEAAPAPPAPDSTAESTPAPASALAPAIGSPASAGASAAPAAAAPETANIVAASTADAGKAALPNVELPLLHITNQNGAMFQRKPSSRGVGMVMVGFAWRDKADMWTRGFKENLPADAQMALVMNLKGQSRLKEKFLTSMMRMDVGDEPIEIYLDWEGEIAAAYGVEDGKAAALTVGADDRLLAIAYDDRDEAKLNRLIDAFGPAKP